MPAVSPSAQGALSSVRVLDFTFVMSGPYCTRLMADLGADVIKIESKTGDLTRSRPPLREGRSSYYASLNCGKRSIVLDLKSPEARDIVHELVKEADVAVENFRPGVMKRLGLGYETLSEINPRLVYCSISGFGGVNVYPQEIESSIRGVPGVWDCAVVGVEDERFGERPVAFVVPVRGMPGGEPSALIAAVRAHCEQHLGRIKRPTRFLVVDSLPRSPTGKLLRRRLREMVGVAERPAP